MKLVYGVGINDADYVVKPTVNGKQTTCPAYRAWVDMLQRCYSAKFQLKNPSYLNTTICKEWESFMAFRAWWLNHQVDSWQLDKDVLGIGGGNLYSPDTCIYIPNWINSFIINNGAGRGEWPIGVCYDKQTGKYKAQCRHPFGNQEYLGLFSNPTDAYGAWLTRKLEIAVELKSQMDEIDFRIYQRVVEIISNAK